jgi:hypothetical protein
MAKATKAKPRVQWVQCRKCGTPFVYSPTPQPTDLCFRCILERIIDHMVQP